MGDDPASGIYVRSKHRACRKAGIHSVQIDLPGATSEEELLEEIDRLNREPSIDGILVQLPLPRGLDPVRVAEAIDPHKDVDGLHPRNAGALMAGRTGPVPCTPRGCLEILERVGTPRGPSRSGNSRCDQSPGDPQARATVGGYRV